MAVKQKRSVHLWVFLAVVGTLYVLASAIILGGIVPKALRAADDGAVLLGFVLTLAWAVVSFYLGREVWRLITHPTVKRKKR